MRMNKILLRLAMLIMFVLAIASGWAAFSMTFAASLWNIILGVLAIFFLFRGLELVDKINNLGPHATPEEKARDVDAKLPGEE